jgi:hypothetical protein
MTINQFSAANAYQGVGVVAFDRSHMLNGQAASGLYEDLCPTNINCAQHFSMLPSDLDGPAPPAGSPNFFAELTNDINGNNTNQLSIFAFHVDFATPANSTFTGPTVLAATPFTSQLCTASRQACITQPGTSQQLEASTSG